MARLTSAQIAEALQRAGIPADTPILGLFYDHSGGKVEVRMHGKILTIRQAELPEATPTEPERTTLFPKPIE